MAGLSVNPLVDFVLVSMKTTTVNARPALDSIVHCRGALLALGFLGSTCCRSHALTSHVTRVNLMITPTNLADGGRIVYPMDSNCRFLPLLNFGVHMKVPDRRQGGKFGCQNLMSS